jgi:hypothetical protein
MRHHKLLRLNKVGAVTIEAGDGANMEEITIHRLKRLADAERTATRRLHPSLSTPPNKAL